MASDPASFTTRLQISTARGQNNSTILEELLLFVAPSAAAFNFARVWQPAVREGIGGMRPPGKSSLSFQTCFQPTSR